MLPLVACALVVLVLYRDLLPLGAAPACAAKWDSVDFAYPYLFFASDCLRSWTVPLWNPLSFSGSPFWGNPQNQLLNPVSLTAALFPVLTQARFQVLLVAQVLLGAMGMYLWGVVRTGSRAAAFFAAVTFAGGGCTVGFMSHYMQLSLQALLPFPFAFYHLWRVHGSHWGMALTPVVVTFWLFTTYPSQLGYQLVALGAFVLWHNVRFEGHRLRVSWRLLLISVLLVFVVPLLLAAPHLVPVAFLLGSITRGPEPLQAAFAGSYHPVNLLSAVAGGLASAPTTLPYPDITLRSLFVGATALTAAVYAMSRPTRDRVATATATLVCLDLCLGADSRLLPLVHAISPLSARSRNPVVDFAGLAVFGLATLSLQGYAEALAQGPRRRRAFVAISAVALASVLGHWTARSFYPALTEWDYQMRTLVLPAIGPVVWLLLLAISRVASAGGLAAVVLAAGVTCDAYWNVRLNQGLVCEADENTATYFKRQSGRVHSSRGGCNNMAGVWPRANTFPSHSSAFILAHKRSNWGYDATVTPSAVRAATEPALSRVMLSPIPLFVAEVRDAAATGRGVNDLRLVFDRHRLHATGDLLRAASGSRPPKVVSWTANSLLVRVRTASLALLVVNEVVAPGWQVEVDGLRRPTVTVNGVLRGVELPPGAREVLWVYRPPGLVLGLVLTAVGLFLLILLLLAAAKAPALVGPARSTARGFRSA